MKWTSRKNWLKERLENERLFEKLRKEKEEKKREPLTLQNEKGDEKEN